jgi:peptidoglycan/LPS O-acetylase OafA/YrhL
LLQLGSRFTHQDAHGLLTASAPQAPSRIETLDAWRGLCMVLVFACHASGAVAHLIGSQNPHLAWRLRETGFFASFGLQYFFVFSGCLITRTLLQAKGSAHYFRNYYVRRVLRIFPLYYTFLLVCLVVLPAVFGRKAVLYDFFDMKLSPTCLWFYGTNIWQTLKHGYCFGHLLHLWSLAVEEHFYLIWPLVVALLPSRRLLQLSWLLIGISTGLRWFMCLSLHDLVSARVNTFCNMDCIAAGAIIAVLLQTKPQDELRRLANLLIAAGLLLFPVYSVISLNQAWFSIATVSTVAAIAFGGVILKTLLQPDACRLPAQNRLKSIGKYCYGLYLMHLPVIHFVSLYLVKDSWPVPVLFGAIFVFSWVIVFALAVLSFQFLESPFLKLKDKFEIADAASSVAQRSRDREPVGAPK